MLWVITAAMRLITVCLMQLSVPDCGARRAGSTGSTFIATMPKVGDLLTESGAGAWPKLQWMYDAPSAKDAAGKIVIHWFCAPKVAACADDLARLITLRDASRVYIVAYINGSNRDAKKLDPIRESEGVGRGTVTFGPGVAKLVKQLAITTVPASIVVRRRRQGRDGPRPARTPHSPTHAMRKVNGLIAAIKEYTATHDGPVTAKPGESFKLSIKVQLASWLAYSASRPPEFDLVCTSNV